MISVVIPAYNEEWFLPACLESLRQQDYKGKYEVVVVDNGSTDGTVRVAAELGARVVSCPKRGVAYAREAGARAARGAIMVQADADTVYPPDWLSRIARHFASNPKSVALAGAYTYYADQSLPRLTRFEFFARFVLNQLGLLLLGRPVFISGANFAFRRGAFLESGGYDATSLYPDQWGISSSLSNAGKISYDKTLLVFTSARRVQNPSHIIFLQICANSGKILAYITRHEATAMRVRVASLRPARTWRRRIASFLTVITLYLVSGYFTLGSLVFGKAYYTSFSVYLPVIIDRL